MSEALTSLLRLQDQMAAQIGKDDDAPPTPTLKDVPMQPAAPTSTVLAGSKRPPSDDSSDAKRSRTDATLSFLSDATTPELSGGLSATHYHPAPCVGAGPSEPGTSSVGISPGEVHAEPRADAEKIAQIASAQHLPEQKAAALVHRRQLQAHGVAMSDLPPTYMQLTQTLVNHHYLQVVHCILSCQGEPASSG